MQYILAIFLFVTSIISLQAQNVSLQPTTDPDFFTMTEPVTITYDVSGTKLSSLSKAYLWIWAPDLSLDAPSNVNPASSNISATAKAEFTKSTTNDGKIIFSITITPSEMLDINDEEVKKIGVLLKGNDWGDGQTVDAVLEINSGFSLKVEKPFNNYGFYSEETEMQWSAKTSQEATITLHEDNTLIHTVTGTDFSYQHSLNTDGQVHQMTLTASTESETKNFKYSYTRNINTLTETLPDAVIDGINYIDDNSVVLVLTAPNKDNVFVIGDFNEWSLNSDYFMKKDGEKFWIKIEGLEKGKEYIFQYLVDGEIRIADPYAEKISSQYDDGEIISKGKYPNLVPYPKEQTSEAASYLQTGKEEYDWQVTDFVKPAKENLMIYEVLVRDFTEERSFRAVIEKLDYFDSLGVNAIELMPVMEFEGNLSWGYNPSSMLAVDKFYGTENDLKELIDKAHARGIAVIFDIVLNHAFGRNSLVRLDNEGLYGAPTATNPWLNTSAKHDYNVGYDFNHESAYTKYYAQRVVEYWIEEYKIDGYRFDLSKGLTQKRTIGNVSLWGQYDASRIAILKNIADQVWAADTDAYVILEHFADNDEEKELANYGMMLWGNMHGNFNSAAKGSSTSLSWLYHEIRGWDEPNLIGYFESHDEERLMWSVNKSLSSTHNLSQRLKRAQLAATFLLAVPGPKLIWQFGEFGYDLELNDDRLGVKPTKWDYLNVESRRKLFNLYQALFNLRTKTNYVDGQYFTWNTDPTFKWINIDHPEVQISIVGNFGRTGGSGDPHFLKAGTWYNYLTGEEVIIEDPNAEIELHSGDILILTSKKIDNYISESAEIILSNETPSFTESTNIFPNPASDVIHVATNEKLSRYRILSLSGTVITESSFGQSDWLNKQNINISHLKAGFYILEINKSGRVSKHKFIKI